MQTADFAFTENFSGDFHHARFVLTGFDMEEEKAITDCLKARGAWVRKKVDFNTACLIVNETYDHQTVKYKQAWQYRHWGNDIAIISFYMFRELCPEVDAVPTPEVAELKPIPFGPGELVFKNALWSALALEDEEEKKLKEYVKNLGGYFGSPLKKTHYVVTEAFGESESRFFDSVKERERVGELRILPYAVFMICTAPNPLAAFLKASSVDKRVAAMQYLCGPAAWKKEPVLCAELERFALHKKAYLLEELFFYREHEAVINLLKLMRAQAESTHRAADKKLLLTLAREYGEQAIALNDASATARWLEFLHSLSPEPLPEEDFTLDPL